MLIEPQDDGTAAERISPEAAIRAGNRWAAAVCGFLLLAVALVFGRTVGYGLVNYDDANYIYQNPHLASGLTVETVAWSFTTTYCSNWHPLTWISYLLDRQLLGPNPWSYHLTNVLLHAATAIALFLVLREMTGDLWASALAAAVFALHPLRVESVAWVSERKDVLSGLFFTLTVGAYVGYARHSHSMVRYAAVVVLFALGLMAKPMLVTLPLVLLLLDVWPLRRMSPPGMGEPATAVRLAVEKLPLLALSAGSCVITFLAQRDALAQNEILSFSTRAGNALVACVAYVGQLVYPAGLAVLYPHPGADRPIWQIAGAAILLALVTGGVLIRRRQCPWLAVGWLWYVGMLVPVIGLVQVGTQPMADRYTYLPQIGLVIAAVWGVKHGLQSGTRRPWIRRACITASVLLVVGLAACAWRQTSYWRDSETLWRHAVDCTPPNGLAHGNLGLALYEEGRVADAIDEYRTAVEIRPDYAFAYNNLGVALAGSGRIGLAVDQYRKAEKILPNHLPTHLNLARALVKLGRIDEAIVECRKTLALNPNVPEVYGNLARMLADRGQLDEAIDVLHQALETDADQSDVRCNLGFLLSQRGRLAEATQQWSEVIRLHPEHVQALNELAWALATAPEASVRNGARAVEMAGRAVKLSGEEEPNVLDTLAAAQAEAGQFAEAVETARKALELATRQNNSSLAESLNTKISLYETGTPFRDVRRPARTDSTQP